MLKVLGAGPGSELEKTINRFSGEKDRLKKALISFIEWKSEHPFNGSVANFPGYGSSDKKFKTFGKFGTQIPGISHAHLTHNISVVYQVDRETNTIKLYGVYSHDDIGTGNPPNPQRQEQMTTRWSNMRFDANQEPTALTTTRTASQPSTKTDKPTKVDYTAKPKVTQPTQQAPKPTDPTFAFVKEITNFWPQRSFDRVYSQAKDKMERLTLLNTELRYLEVIKQKNRLYPNQLQYEKGLKTLYNYLTQR